MPTGILLCGARQLPNQKQKIREQLEQIWDYVQSVYEQEKDFSPMPDFEEISPEKAEKAIAQINEALNNKKTSQEVKKTKVCSQTLGCKPFQAPWHRKKYCKTGTVIPKPIPMPLSSG